MVSAQSQTKLDQKKVHQRWPGFTEMELGNICRNLQSLSGGLQARYGLSEDEAARQIQEAYDEIALREFS